VVRGRRLGRGQAELRVADDLVAGEREERRFGQVAGALHVVLEPVLERLHHLVAVAGDVRERFTGDFVDSADEVRPLGPRHDLHSLGRRDRLGHARGELEDHASVAFDLVKPSLRRERDARFVVFGDRRVDRVDLVLPEPGRDPFVERRSEATPAVCGEDRDERLADAWPPWHHADPRRAT
jgi:hypothetical protein